jgi:hypothetical protein
VIEEVAPANLCRGVPEEEVLWIWGEGFAPFDPERPFDGVQVALVETGSASESWMPWISEAAGALLVMVSDSPFPARFDPPRQFDVKVINPDGQAAVQPAALTAHESISLTGVSPTSAPAGSTVALTLTGNGFYGRVRLQIGSDVTPRAEVTPATRTTATADLELPADLPPGTYQLTIENAGGCEDTLDLAFEVLAAE